MVEGVGRTLRAFVFTQEEPFFIPKVIRHLADHQGREYEIVGATVLKPHRKNKTMRHWLRERTRIYTTRELLLAGMAYVLCKGWETAAPEGKGRYSVRHLLEQRKIERYETEDVNDPAFVARLKALEVDVILSVSPPQIFKAELIGAASAYAFNAHGTLLPRHRGVFGSWWTLYCGGDEAGATVHTMEVRLDAGENVWQQAVPLGPDDTQYSVAYKTKRLLAQGLVDVLRQVHEGTLRPLDKPYEESYHRAPTRAEGAAFHRKGLRVIRARDLRYMLASRFNSTGKP